MEIQPASLKDASDIAKIHKTEIDQGFLSSLPEIFLEKLYKCIIENDICVVAKEEGKVIGFIAGAADVSKFYSVFLEKYFIFSFFILFFKFFNFSNLKKIIEDLLYSRKAADLPGAELLTVAVKKEFQGKGVANELFKLFVSKMKERNIKVFKVLVGEKLKPAIAFYEKNNFEFLKNISIHSKEKSRIYIYKI